MAVPLANSLQCAGGRAGRVLGSSFAAGSLVLRSAPAGLFFYRWPRSHTPMDPDLENVIRQALADAQAAGKDYLSQTELAVRAVQRARPDMTASDALAAVNLVRHE